MMYKNFICGLLVTLAMGSVANADLISEFEPNPPGGDPATSTVEWSGVAGAPFSGFLTFLETDGTTIGAINSSDAVSGTFDASGIAVVSLDFDVENPSYTLVYSSLAPTADVDADDDGSLDDTTVFGTVFDAVGIIDAAGDATNFATELGGVEFSTPEEFEIAFRDASTGQFFGFDAATGDVVDTVGTVFTAADFDLDPALTTTGSINPTLITSAAVPEPSSTIALALAAGVGLLRRRR